jgi:carbamoyltransferase
VILGLSAFEHNPAAVLFNDGVVEAAIEDNKLTRSPGRGVPQAAIQYCLSKAGIGWDDLQSVAVAARPLRALLRKSLWRARQTLSFPLDGLYHEAKELGTLSREWNNSRSLVDSHHLSPARLANLEHHLCHAAAAFYASPFDRALILTLDEEGDGWSGLLALGEGTEIKILHRIPFPHSLGWVYSQMTALLGFIPHQEEHKVQWLSLEGEPVFGDLFVDMLMNSRHDLPSLNRAYFNGGRKGGLAFSQHFYQKIGYNPHNGAKVSPEQRAALASSVQHACTEVVAELIERYRKREGIDNICLGGGLFDNTLLVADLEKRCGIPLFVPPAPGNAGCALGAASLVWHQTLKQPRTQPATHVYWGPKYSRQDIKDVLDNCKARYALHYTEAEKLEAAVQLLQSGKIVAWYQGATEFGSRALGNRSLLASPWAPYVKENLNDYIKHREWFRPFALAVPEEDCSEYFEHSPLSRFMTSLAYARPTADETLRGFFLPGNRVRLQVVTRQSNPLFWRLLKRFGEQAPAPILVNTSFNLFGEPLVVSPRDALRSFYCSGVDALMIDNFLLKKHNG